MPGSVVDPMDRDMRQVLEHLPGRGPGHHSSGRPVKGLLGLPHLVLDEHVDQGGQKKDHPQGLQPLFLLQEEGVEDEGILDEGPEDVLDGGLPLVLVEDCPGGGRLLGKIGDENETGLPIPLLSHRRGVDPAHRHVHQEDGGLGEALALLGAAASRTGLFDGLGLDGEGEREEPALVRATERLSRRLGITLAEEGSLGQLPGGLLKSRLLLGDGGEKAPALAFVERGGVIDDETIGTTSDDGGLLGGPVGGGILLVPERGSTQSGMRL